MWRDLPIRPFHPSACAIILANPALAEMTMIVKPTPTPGRLQFACRTRQVP